MFLVPTWAVKLAKIMAVYEVGVLRFRHECSACGCAKARQKAVPKMTVAGYLLFQASETGFMPPVDESTRQCLYIDEFCLP